MGPVGYPAIGAVDSVTVPAFAGCDLTGVAAPSLPPQRQQSEPLDTQGCLAKAIARTVKGGLSATADPGRAQAETLDSADDQLDRLDLHYPARPQVRRLDSRH